MEFTQKTLESYNELCDSHDKAAVVAYIEPLVTKMENEEDKKLKLELRAEICLFYLIF
jgi:hypothetical protein